VLVEAANGTSGGGSVVLQAASEVSKAVALQVVGGCWLQRVVGLGVEDWLGIGWVVAKPMESEVWQ